MGAHIIGEVEASIEFVAGALFQTTSGTYVSMAGLLAQYDPANWREIKAAYFEAVIAQSVVVVDGAYARLYNETDGAAITGSEVSTTVLSATRVRSGDILANLPSAAKNLTVQMKNNAGLTAYLWQAKLILVLSDD